MNDITRLIGNAMVSTSLILPMNPVLAGMPSPELIFTELGKRRWEELSFFLMGFLLMAAVVQFLWNHLRRDFPALPVLSYRRSLSLMLLWGLLMTVVLAMISGARELMTPGAWKPTGVTYKLTRDAATPSSEKAPDLTRDLQRRLRLENLRFALWQFASSHSGHFPNGEESRQIPEELWLAEPESGARYIYVHDQAEQKQNGILVYEPEIFDDRQYLLRINGEIAKETEARPVVPTAARRDVPQPKEPASLSEPARADDTSATSGGVQ